MARYNGQQASTVMNIMWSDLEGWMLQGLHLERRCPEHHCSVERGCRTERALRLRRTGLILVAVADAAFIMDVHIFTDEMQ